MTSRPLTDIEALFDEPGWWRAQAALALDLSGEELIAAVSPQAGQQAILRSVLASLPPGLQRIADIGAGVGGVSEWFRIATGATVIAVEPMQGACDAAELLFPRLHVLRGTADRTGVQSAAADLVLLCGLTSLLEDLRPLFDEVDRILTDDGHVAVIDLFANGRTEHPTRRNRFRTFDDLRGELQTRGFAIVDVGCGSTPPDGRTEEHPSVAERVERWIEERHGREEVYAQWRQDRAELDELIHRGDIIFGCLVARRHLARAT